jgi:hypothetical protein
VGVGLAEDVAIIRGVPVSISRYRYCYVEKDRCRYDVGWRCSGMISGKHNYPHNLSITY